MSYKRPINTLPLTKEQKIDLLKEYVAHYTRLYSADPGAMNRKIPRQAFDDVTDQIGRILLKKSKALASKSRPIHQFLKNNPLPKSMRDMLPDEFRVFCLALNALKQWVSAEQQATDRYLMGSTARETCRLATSSCIVSGQKLTKHDIRLHHPVRDGRPPIPLTKKGHDQIEGQSSTTARHNGDVSEIIRSIRRDSNQSWAQLRRGCQDLLGKRVAHSTNKVKATAQSFARKVSAKTDMYFKDIIAWLDESNL